jgi:hypothetical protein
VPVTQQSSVAVVAMYKRIIKKHDLKTILFFTGYRGGGNCWKLFTMIRSKALTEQMVLKLAQDFLDAIPTLPRITFPMPSMC